MPTNTPQYRIALEIASLAYTTPWRNLPEQAWPTVSLLMFHSLRGIDPADVTPANFPPMACEPQPQRSPNAK